MGEESATRVPESRPSNWCDVRTEPESCAPWGIPINAHFESLVEQDIGAVSGPVICTGRDIQAMDNGISYAANRTR